MDLAHAHVQIKDKHTAAFPPVVCRTAAYPPRSLPLHRCVVRKRCSPRPLCGPSHHLLSPTASTMSRTAASPPTTPPDASQRPPECRCPRARRLSQPQPTQHAARHAARRPLPSPFPLTPSPQVDCQVLPLRHQRTCANAVTTPPPHQRANADDPTTLPCISPAVAQPPLSQQRPNADAPPPTQQHCRQFPVNALPPTPCQRRLARAERRERSKRCCPPPP
jgi:hypothetical protein